MKLIFFLPLILLVALVSYLLGNHMHDRELARDEAINRVRMNEHADKAHKELKRLTSPDGQVDAIIAEVQDDPSNSNVPLGYAIYLVPAGRGLNLGWRYPNPKVFYANRITGLEPVWRDRDFLEIRYTRGDIFEFQNNWILNKDLRVEIRIVPPSESHSLSN